MQEKDFETKAEEAVEALGDAVTRAVHHAPESLLRHFDTGRRDFACRRLTIRIVVELAGDGWAGKDEDALEQAICTGVGRTADGFLATLSDARRGDVRLLDAIGLHIGGLIYAAMQEGGAALVRDWTGRPRLPPEGA